MRKELMLNSIGVMAVIDNEFYIQDEKWECYKKCSKNEFIEELKNMSWVCLTSWDKKFRQQYLDLVDYVKELK